jgi:hypothetical protein
VTGQDAHGLIIWRLLDGKPGHENQSLGLSDALSRQLPCTCYDISVKGRLTPLFYWLFAAYPPGSNLPAPDLIIGAGHQTHLHLLTARRARGGKAIVLMRPSLPLSLFDLCLLPEHDGYRGNAPCLETRGVLNALQSAGRHVPHKALILIGGPSRHHGWDLQMLLQQIEQLVGDNPETGFLLTTSRRTPSEFVAEMRRRQPDNLEVVPVDETGPGWVAGQLAERSTAWVTEDSVSMVYEALTAGVAVGVLKMPAKGESRVSRGLRKLLNEGLVVPFDDRGDYRAQMQPVADFNEADRCARWIAERWLSAG